MEYLRFLKEAADQIELSTELKAAYDIDNNSSQEMVLAAKMAHLEKMLFMAGDKYQPPEA